jgi:hypothetical protein
MGVQREERVSRRECATGCTGYREEEVEHEGESNRVAQREEGME